MVDKLVKNPTFLNSYYHLALVQFCIRMNRWGFPVRIDILGCHANAILQIKYDRNYTPVLQATSSESLPTIAKTVGKNWYKKFLARHEDLKVMHSRYLDHSRAQNNNPTLIKECLNLYHTTCDQYNIKTENKYNMDEKGFLLGLVTSTKVIVTRKEQNRFVTQDGNRETITVLETVSAVGKALAPMIIFKGKYHQQDWYQDAENYPKDWLLATLPKGWTDSRLAIIWLTQLFGPSTQPSNSNDYQLLIIDAHNSHITCEFIEFCVKHCINALCLPLHATHLLQSLDVGIFGPFQNSYGREVEDAVCLCITGFNKVNFLPLYVAARAKVLQKRTIRNAFSATGLVPYNPKKVFDKIPNYVLLPEDNPTAQRSSTLNKSTNSSTNDPVTPKATWQAKQPMAEILGNIEHLPEVETPTRKRILQLGKAVEFAFADNAIEQEINTQLRNANKRWKIGDKRVLSKEQVLSMEEALRLREKAKEKAVIKAKKKVKTVATKESSATTQLEKPKKVFHSYYTWSIYTKVLININSVESFN